MLAMQPQRRVSHGGPERFVLALALFLPLGVMAVAVLQLSGLPVSMSLSSAPAFVDTSPELVTHRPIASSAAVAPPTLVAATATPVPTPTPLPAPSAPAAAPGARTYTVQRGDELKHIAADYGVSIWTIIDANDIPNPDSLRVGQVLKIPNN